MKYYRFDMELFPGTDMMLKKCILFVTVLVSLFLAACGNVQEGPMSGKWAYIHETDKAALIFNGNKAVLDGKKYDYTVDGEYIMLTRNSKTTPMRFLETKDGMYIYKTAVYTLKEGSGGKGLIGIWKDPERNWSFEFNEKAEFLEDGVLPGHYSVDENAGTFKLMYNDPVEDTVCYFKLDGDRLTVEYPWFMVKMD